MTDLDHRIGALVSLGEIFGSYSRGDRKGEHMSRLHGAVEKAEQENPWFTPENTGMNISSWAEALTAERVREWAADYESDLERINKPAKIGMVMAGNIPMVGLHDLLSVFLSGHSARVKLSSQDKVLLPVVSSFLSEKYPGWEKRCNFTDGKLEDFEAIIATGSDNSSRYFEYYFGRYPHIIRKNRNSVAVIDGREDDAELEALGIDIFSYFGLGCRNVSKLFLPRGYDISRLLIPLKKFNALIHHHKYANNYDYQKSIVIINNIPHHDTGALLLLENEIIVSPISVAHYEFYDDKESLHDRLVLESDSIQCIAGSAGKMDAVPFGRTQFPSLTDYADGKDTMKFLLAL